MASDRGLVRARWARLTTTTRIALLVIAVQLVVRAWLILPNAYFQDDFVVLRASREGAPTIDSLMRSGNGHLSPGTYLTGWVLAQFPGSYLPAAIDLLVLQLLGSVFLWLMLRRAVGDRTSVVVGLATALFTPLMLTTVTWWAAGEVMLALQLAMTAAGYFHLRFLQSRSQWWVCGAAGAMVFGYLFTEKALFLPVFLLLLTVLVATDGFRHLVRELLRTWLVWIVYGALAAGYLLVYLRFAEVGHGGAQSVSDALGFVRAQLLDVFARGIVGGPWNGSIAASGQWLPISALGIAVVVQVLVAIAVVAYRVSGRRSLVAWGVLGCYLGLNVALTVRGRGFFAILLQMDPRYVCDAIPIAALALTVMFSPPRGRPPRVPTWAANRSTVIACAAVVVLFNSSMITTSRVAETLHHHPVTDYVHNARVSLGKEPDAVLYDGFVPQSIMIGVFPDVEKRVSSVLGEYDVDARYDRPSSQMRILDDTGVARPISLVFTQTGEIDDQNKCGVALVAGRSAFVTLNRLIPKGDWVMRVDYYTATSVAVDVTTSGDAQPVGFLSGPRSVFLTVHGGASYVEFASRQGPGTICITGVTVGFPVPGAS
jgi:hypothetical protein